MKLEFLANSMYWAIVISLASYVFGDAREVGAVMNDSISVALTSVFLLATGSDYSQYKANSCF